MGRYESKPDASQIKERKLKKYAINKISQDRLKQFADLKFQDISVKRMSVS
jgi:hypothetical protein